MANSPWLESYEAFRDFPLKVGVGEFKLAKPLLLWINDGLMAIFFLLVALEIKRETLSGQLAGREQLMLPLVCAIAGVVVPALLFFSLNHGDAAAMRGWAVPTATDIAFALGVLALLGSRVPVGMKLLLSTIAVVDDLIAILIIALFYSHGMSFIALGLAALVLAVMWLSNRRHVTALWPYLLLGVVLWVCVLKSGVHATLAGVATGLLIPHVDKRNVIPDEIEHSPLEYARAHAASVGGLRDPAGVRLRQRRPGAGWPADEGRVRCVAAGYRARTGGGQADRHRRRGAVDAVPRRARFPAGMDLRAMLGLGTLCGIGFTMSLFIASLAYHDRLLYEEVRARHPRRLAVVRDRGLSLAARGAAVAYQH